MGIHNNTPNFTWISIKGLNIQKGDNFYSISDIKTPMNHLYWELDNPYVLRPSNQNLGTNANRYLLYRNNFGEVIEVPNDDLIITYSDGESNPIFEDKIISLTEKVDDNNSKIVQHEQSIDGFKQTVGDWKVSEDGTIKESVAKISQSSKDIDLKVDDVTKTLNENKEVDDLREAFIKSAIDFNAQLGITDSLLYGYYGDKIISDEEDKNIKSLLSILDLKRTELVSQTNRFINLAKTNNQTTEMNAMITERDNYNDSVNNLINYITTAISYRTMTTVKITGITSAMSKCSTKINTLKDVVNDFLFLGSGGKIIEEMARVSIKSNELVLQVKSTNDLVRTTLGVEKNIINGHILDYKNENDKLRYNISVYSVDGLSNSEERASINKNISDLVNQRQDIISKYNEIYNNKYLTTNGKNQIKSAFDVFMSKSNEANDKIEDYFADGFVNESEINDSYVLLTEAYDLLLELGVQLGYGIDEIDNETKKAELQSAKDDLKKEIDDVNSNVSNLNDYVDGTFKDNVIDENEKKILGESVKSFETEKVDIDNTYNQLHSSKYLDGVMKTQFEIGYTNFNVKYTALITAYNSVINKNDLISNLDRQVLTIAENEFNVELGKFKFMANKVIEYINDKSSAELKTEFDKKIGDLDIKVDGIQSDIETTISDGLIDESEKITLNSSIELLYNEYTLHESEYIKLRDNTNLTDEFKLPMKDNFNEMALQFGMLISLLETLVAKTEKITDAEKLELKDYFANYRKQKDLYIQSAYNSIDAIKNKSISDMKDNLNKEIDDVTKSVTKLEENMNGIFKEGVLSDSEKLGLKQSLQAIQKDKIDVDNGYTVLYSNVDLLDPAKSNLKNAYNDYVNKYNELIKYTNKIINESGIPSQSDKTAFETAYANFKTSSGVYVKRVNEAMDSIAKRKKDLAESNSKSYTDTKISVLQKSIELKVSQQDYDDANQKLVEQMTKLTQSVDGWDFAITRTGGGNLIANSNFEGDDGYKWFKNAGGILVSNIPYLDSSYGKMVAIENPNSVSSSAGIFQRFKTIPGQTYTCSFYTLADTKVIETSIGIEGVNTISIKNEPGFKRWSIEFVANSTEHTFIAYAKEKGFFYLGRVMVNSGGLQEYTKRTGEIYSAHVKFDEDGVTIDNNEIDMYTNIDARGLEIYNKILNKSILYAKDGNVEARGGHLKVVDPDNGYTLFWGRDIVINGGRALVGTGDVSEIGANKVWLNYNNDFKNGVEIGGYVSNNGKPMLSEQSYTKDLNGHIQLTNGLTIQWGLAQFEVINGNNVQGSIAFNKVFPNRVCSMVATIVKVDGKTDLATKYSSACSVANSSYADFFAQNLTNDKWGAYMDVNWIAIGF